MAKHTKSGERPPIEVVIEEDFVYRKKYRVISEDRIRQIVVEREFISNYHALWRWYDGLFFQLAHHPPPPPPVEWPTWERALEDALDRLDEVAYKTMESGV